MTSFLFQLLLLHWCTSGLPVSIKGLPTYSGECSTVNLSDSKRFSRSGLDAIQTGCLQTRWLNVCQQFRSSRLPHSTFRASITFLQICYIKKFFKRFSIFSFRTKDSPPQEWCLRDRSARQPFRRHCFIRGKSSMFWIAVLCWFTFIDVRKGDAYSEFICV